MDSDRKTDKEEIKTNHAKLLATMEADRDETKAAMQYKRSELDDTIQHRIENIFDIFEHDKRNLQSELTEKIKKTTKVTDGRNVPPGGNNEKLQRNL
jgi:cell division ATPase FtsA